MKRYIKQRKETKKWFWDYKKGKICCVCGENHRACIQFHHSEPFKKEDSISKMVNRGCDISSLLKELKKCIVVCANCHAKIHWEKYFDSGSPK